MIEKSHTAEDAFFSVLDCAKAYCEYINSDDGEEPSEPEASKITAYAVYLQRLNEQSLKQSGEPL